MHAEISLAEILKARKNVYRFLKPTPLLEYPLLSEQLGCSCFIKHENHNPTGAFKVRGGLNFMAHFAAAEPGRGIISATRGNHGQSLALAARAYGIPCTIVMPRGNNPEKNDAMMAFGARLVEHGADFDEARVHAELLAADGGSYYVSSGDEAHLINGVGTYALEIFEDLPDVDTIIVPMGGGSGVCGVLAVAGALNPGVEVIGVQAENAPCLHLSWMRGQPVETTSAATFADGLATRVPFRLTFEYFKDRIHDVVLVSEEEIRTAIRMLLRSTHNLAEGAGAASLAAAVRLRERLSRKKVVLVLSGGNIDSTTLKWVVEDR